MPNCATFFLSAEPDAVKRNFRTLNTMSETPVEYCGKCGAEIDPTRRVDFTLKDGTRVCDACFVKETPRPARPKNDWPE